MRGVRVSACMSALVALFALGLMAKPQIITLPFVLLLWDYWPLRRMFAPADAADAEFAPQPLSYLVMEKLPLLRCRRPAPWSP